MATRINLTDGSGWFDESKSQHFEEATWWNGNNHISVATGSQWDHERLYRTASGKWVLNWWSQYQGVRETYEQIDDSAAIAWLIQNKRVNAILDNEPDSECGEKIREHLQACEL